MKFSKPYQKFSEIYDKIMNDKFYNSYAKFIFKALRRFKFGPKKILDIACGTGRLAKFFLLKGYSVEGIDSSAMMLNIARKRGIKCHKQVISVFNLSRRYDLILCTFDSLNYLKNLKEIKKCFSSVKKHLETNGFFIFDLNSDFKINNLITSSMSYRKIDDTEFIWLNFKKPNIWISKIILFVKKNKQYQRYDEKHIEKAYKFESIKKLLRQSDFKILGVYSDFDFAPVKKYSPRWFFVCQKQERAAKKITVD